MKKLFFVLLASLVAGIMLTGGCTGEEIKDPVVDIILAADAFVLMQENPNHVLIDLRTPEAFANEHIPKAINIPFQSENFLNEIDKLDKNKTTIFYYKPYDLCSFQYCRPSETLLSSVEIFSTLKKLHFKKAYLIEGGLIAWKFEGLPTTR